VCDFDFGGAATGEQGLFLDNRADGAMGVVKGALGLLENKGVCATADD
jgi:hypothetical protein